MPPGLADDTATVRAASAVSLSAGLWLCVSVSYYGSSSSPDAAWNSWVVGATVATLAAIRLGYPMKRAWISWVNSLLGAWIFASPFIYSYADDTGRFANSLCVGGIVAFAALASAAATPGEPMGVRPTRARNGRTMASRVH